MSHEKYEIQTATVSIFASGYHIKSDKMKLLVLVACLTCLQIKAQILDQPDVLTYGSTLTVLKPAVNFQGDIGLDITINRGWYFLFANAESYVGVEHYFLNSISAIKLGGGIAFGIGLYVEVTGNLLILTEDFNTYYPIVRPTIGLSLCQDYAFLVGFNIDRPSQLRDKVSATSISLIRRIPIGR